MNQPEHGKRVLAAAFLVVLLLEWGSHSMVDAHLPTSDAPSISAHGAHGDLCNTLLLCSDARGQDPQNRGLGRDVPQSAGPIVLLSRIGSGSFFQFLSQTLVAPVEAIFRPPNTPFHPPEVA